MTTKFMGSVGWMKSYEEEVSNEEEVFVDCVVVEVADDVEDESEDESED